MMTYDQLQIPNLASAEAMIKRRMVIERAYQLGRPDAPNYTGSNHFQGIRETADGTIVDPALNKYTSDRLHHEFEVTRNARLANQEFGRPQHVPEGGDDDDAAAGVQPKPRGGRGGCGGR